MNNLRFRTLLSRAHAKTSQLLPTVVSVIGQKIENETTRLSATRSFAIRSLVLPRGNRYTRHFSSRCVGFSISFFFSFSLSLSLLSLSLSLSLLQTEQFTVLWLLFAMIVVGNIAVLIGLLWGKRRKTRMDFFIKQLAFAGKFCYI